jgi:UDP-2,3-diacylglucosamine pyrophosphatase LpxH
VSHLHFKAGSASVHLLHLRHASNPRAKLCQLGETVNVFHSNAVQEPAKNVTLLTCTKRHASEGTTAVVKQAGNEEAHAGNTQNVNSSRNKKKHVFNIPRLLTSHKQCSIAEPQPKRTSCVVHAPSIWAQKHSHAGIKECSPVSSGNE